MVAVRGAGDGDIGMAQRALCGGKFFDRIGATQCLEAVQAEARVLVLDAQYAGALWRKLMQWCGRIAGPGGDRGLGATKSAHWQDDDAGDAMPWIAE